jgi:CHASE2 domain-containing sensor protein
LEDYATNWFTARFRALLIAIVTAVTVWTLSLLGLFSVPSWWLYDRFAMYSSSHVYQPNVVLVNLPEDGLATAVEWRSVLDRLAELKAAQIVVLLQDVITPDLLTLFSEKHNIVVGRYLTQDPADPDKLRLQPWPTSGQGITYGVANLPLTAQGIIRHTPVSRYVDGKLEHPMALVAALQRDLQSPQIMEHGLLINFNQGRYSLPTLDVDRLLAGEVIEELITGRSVIIGLPLSPSSAGVYTPATFGAPPMSCLEYHGHALDSLLGNRLIKVMPAWLTLLSLLAITLTCAFIYQWFMIHESAWFTVLSLAFYMTLGWLSLWLLNSWIHVVEFALAQCTMFFWVSHEKSAHLEQEMRSILAEMSLRLRKIALPPRFYDSPHHWEQLVTMVDQTLSLTRLIFLERVEGDHRVKEIQALRCSLDSIDERRRDYERTPYSTAIVAGGPIRIDRTFLTKSDLVTEDQYLAPLIYAGEILGFWAFGVDMAKIQSRQQMESMAKDFCYQIAELIYHRRHWLNKGVEEARILSQYLRLQGGEVINRDVHHALELMERRLSVHQSVFDGLETATVLYDLFGRVMQINRNFEQLMSKTEIPAFDYTALDLMSALLNYERGDCQLLLRQVIMERRNLVVPIHFKALGNRPFLLRMRALKHDDSSTLSTMDSTPFELLGVLFELSDVSPIHRLYSHKEKLYRDLKRQIFLVLDDTAQQSGEAAALNHSLPILRSTNPMKDEWGMLNDGIAFLSKEIGNMPLQLYPIDGCLPIFENIEEIKEQAEASDIHIVADFPEHLSLVMAEPEQLHELTASVLDTLINDAAESSTIHVIVDEQDSWIRYRFYNEGFGMPNDRLQEFLFRDASVTEGYTQLRNVLHRVKSWGGVVEASSELGVGTNIEIKLRAFVKKALANS